ncbi:Polyphenol oxidase, chloroplastic [Capsicum baccatum]|uniref:Polyphenol oxidase, chloroplastic n=1 Tax=Capsicum baccatum TaxID=33114 RepID=A0A2G2XES3_CAPBA|nr:Polyphenol oxidase, chloroplastic [Capsicum baccatum]
MGHFTNVKRYLGKVPDLDMIFTCGDPTVVQTEFYQRPKAPAPSPVFHYCSNDASLDIAFPDWSFWRAQAIGKTANDFIQEQLKMDCVYDVMFHLLNEYSKLLKYKPTIPENAVELCSEAMACPAEGITKKFMGGEAAAEDGVTVWIVVFVEETTMKVVFVGFADEAPVLSWRSHDKGEKKRKTRLKLAIIELLEDLDAENNENVLVTFVPKNDSGAFKIGDVKIVLDN